MSHEHMKTAIAGGNIRRSRVVMLTDEFIAVEMSTNLSNPSFGIAQEWCRQPQGTPFNTSMEAATSGEEFLAYTQGQIGLAECGGTVTAGKMQTTDSTGRIVDSTGSPPQSFWNVFRAEENGTTGLVVRGMVL